MKQSKQFTPRSLQTILVTLFIFLLVGGVAVQYYYFEFIEDYAKTVSQSQAAATASSKQVTAIQAIKDQSPDTSTVLQKVDQLFATNETYQSQASTDIRSYAAASGLQIKSIVFKSDSPRTAVVEFASPASYSKLITFLSNIETNIPKLIVTSIALRNTNATNTDTIIINTMEIEALAR